MMRGQLQENIRPARRVAAVCEPSLRFGSPAATGGGRYTMAARHGGSVGRWLMGVLLVCLAGASCVPPTPSSGALNPFTDLPAAPIDGVARPLTSNIVRLGELAAGTVLEITTSGRGLESVLVLTRDPTAENAGVIVGGGAANATFLYRVQWDAAYYLYVRVPETADAENAGAVPPGVTLAIGPGDPAFEPPARQIVRVVFAPGYLTGPGLVDPESFTAEEIEVLASLEGIVREQVMAELRDAFAQTPIVIIDENEPLPAEPFSTLTFSPQRMLVDPNVSFDSAIPAIPPEAGCDEAVVFGEVLPRGTLVDPGNSNPADEAVVYVGSFQGRGLACRTAVLSSLTHIVLALAHTAEHEIGHMVGLYHIALTDIMDRRPTAAFSRDLGFGRGQVLIDIPETLPDGSVNIQTRVLTNIIQEPSLYWWGQFGYVAAE